MKRFFEVDSARGLALLAMIAFHALFDLNFFAGYSFSLFSGPFFFLGRFAAFTFIFLVGLSLTLSFNKSRKKLKGFSLFKKYLFRGLKVFSLGLIITGFSFVLFPAYTIVFGVLHLIGLSIILAFPFLKKKNASLAVGIAAIAAGLFLGTMTFSFPWLLWLGFMPFDFQSFDYVPLLPWFGVVLLGAFAGNLLYPKGTWVFSLPDLSASLPVKLLSFLGRHSLLIYFVHQPILVAAIMFLTGFF